VLISNGYSNRLVHKWRSEEAAIAVGTNTALFDDPQLSTRHWPGRNPVRVVVDMNLRLPSTLKLFNGEIPTIVFNLHQHSLPFEKISLSELRNIGLAYYQVTEDVSLVHQMLNGLYRLGIQSLMVEGGTALLQSFIDEGLWDEARIICNEDLVLGSGLPAPVLKNARLVKRETILSDTICTWRPASQ
jgi:diaminohydroxyphosphoribosylaminopyrimidine deaminase/5-amino-6-(5-phosphoribosylamino)uracil reductase